MDVKGFEFPDNVWVLPEWDTWCRQESEGIFTVGITSLGVELSGELYMCRPKSVGTELEQGKSVGVAELAKSVVSIKTPVSGVVLEVNSALEDRPNLPFKDPYGQGWLARIKVNKWQEECQKLLQGEVLAEYVLHRMHLFRVAERTSGSSGRQVAS